MLCEMKRDGGYLLVYDITADKLRAKVAKVAEGYGLRIQKSAFECRLTRGMKARLWAAMEAFELGDEDSVALYSVAAGSALHLGAGAREHPQSENRHVVIL
jgi:CRISPR-associated protein Cas2